MFNKANGCCYAIAKLEKVSRDVCGVASMFTRGLSDLLCKQHIGHLITMGKARRNNCASNTMGKTRSNNCASKLFQFAFANKARGRVRIPTFRIECMWDLQSSAHTSSQLLEWPLLTAADVRRDRAPYAAPEKLPRQQMPFLPLWTLWQPHPPP